MSHDEIEVKKPTQIEVAIKDETAEHPKCPLCPDPMLPGEELRLMRSREGSYNVHMKCYLRVFVDNVKPYQYVGKRKYPGSTPTARGGYRRRWF